ncbi:MAG: hypothetical protein WAV51_00730 [Microgenomates group bacterium]
MDNFIVLLVFQGWEFVKTLRKYLPGGLYLVLCLLVAFWYKAPILPIFRSMSDATYTYGILTISFVAWTIAYWAFVLTRKEYEIPPKTEKQKATIQVGNRNLVSVLFGVVAVLIFWLLGISRLALIIIGVIQFSAFVFGDKFQQQAEYILPKFVNFSLLLLGAWIVGA